MIKFHPLTEKIMTTCTDSNGVIMNTIIVEWLEVRYKEIVQRGWLLSENAMNDVFKILQLHSPEEDLEKVKLPGTAVFIKELDGWFIPAETKDD